MTGRAATADRVSETFYLGALLALVGGFLDAYTYCTRGGVFANSQTGNMALLGISLINGKWQLVLNYLIPILAYAAGVFVSEFNRCNWSGQSLHWRQITIMAEILIVAVVAFLPESMNMLATVLVSVLCAVQAQSFRKVHGVSYVNTTCSGNLRSSVELFYRFLRKKDHTVGRGALIYLGIICIFILGVMAGAFCSNHFGHRSVLICIIPLLTAFLMLFCFGSGAKQEKKVCR